MWIFMFVMMATVATRSRSSEDSGRARTQVVDNGASETVPTTRKRNRQVSATTNRQVSTTIAIVNQDANQQTVDPPNQQTVDPPKRRGRGPNLNRSATRDLEGKPEGSKISLKMADGVKNFVGPSATQFATECGIVLRSTCPMNFHTWESIPKDVKIQIYEKLHDKFLLLRENNVFMEYVDTRLKASWKRFRGVFSAHWKTSGGKTNPQLARSKISPKCRSQEDWDHLCNYWELDSTKKYSEQMEANRGKQIVKSRGGSRSIVNLIYKMTDRETQTPPSPLDVYAELHYKADKQGYLNDHARVQHEAIHAHKQAAKEKLISEGKTIDAATEHTLEREAIRSVCAKDKKIKSAWEPGVGPVFRKKDYWMTSEAQSSQPRSSDTEELRNHIAELNEELKKNNDELTQSKEKLRLGEEKYDKIMMFMRSKFPDFENSVSTPASDGVRLDEQVSDGDSLDPI